MALASTLLNLTSAIGSLSNTQASAPLSIGPLSLIGMEVPSILRVGGQQMLMVHRLPGGDRVIDAAGNDPNRLTLSGVFVGPNSLSRAESVEKLRNVGKPLDLFVANLDFKVIIYEFYYLYQNRGFTIPYEMVLEVYSEKTATTPSADIASIIGDSAAAAYSGIASAITSVSTFTKSVVGTLTGVIGQVTPLANLTGAGGVLAKAQTQLTQVSTIASTTTNLTAAPDAAASMFSSLQSAGENISTAVTQTGQNLEGISLNSTAGIGAAMQNAQVHSAAVDAGANVNVAAKNVNVAGGVGTTTPIVS